MTKDKENRLAGALQLNEQRRLDRLEANRAIRGRDDSPLEERKLTQQEAAAYSGVSGTTIKRWEAEGLKTVWKGNSRRYRVVDLQEFLSRRTRGAGRHRTK